VSYTSYNGYTASKNPADFGGLATVSKGLAKWRVRATDGIPTIFQYLVDQLDARVERAELYNTKDRTDDYGYLFRKNRNANNISCHGSGTAIDYNATRHPNGVRWDRNFSAADRAEIHRIINDELDGVIDWGGDWTKTVDAMHFEINGSLAKVRDVAARIKSGEIHPPKVEEPKPAPAPEPKGKISLAKAQAGMKAGGKGEPSPEVKLIQAALGFKGDDVDGYYGQASRKKAAAFQVKISAPPKPRPWPEAGWDRGGADADGILGRQSLTALGFEVTE
jgi:hypothetical protein